MRTVTFGINISIDGYCDHTSFNPSEEVLDYFTDMMDDVDLVFFGRVMYQLMFPYWNEVAKDQSGTPAENRFAQKFSNIDRVVVSQSLNGDQKTKIIRSHPAEALLKLKQQPGKKILVDTISMLPVLIAAGLIDEFKLVVHPAIIGKGRPLLDVGSLEEKLDLKLVDTIHFNSGSIALHYVKQGREMNE
ncbi:dihydrofolate reductase family protein [Chitinophaga pendula]|uniref:dihydrofolate reductase family protein n=1 Tax=Chitinophaga TaxID=79328 RepID=UPI000BB08CE6|nr:MULTISPECIES: dihydrofolate reductase family protein [Chitinophaga]ASZ14055.1 deaminase [Chitinophaga sp. MD30]UCJ08314.1 dihydrofolate reductase family protein [Chitinophaga pendula]